MHAVAALKAVFPLAILLTVSGLKRSTYYYHQQKAHQPDKYAALKDAIRAVFAKARGRYGYRRIVLELVADGWCVGKKLVRKLMRECGLVCRIRQKRYRAHRGATGKVAGNVLNREFTATTPNQKWVTDVTEFKVAGKRVYLSPVMDLFDRQIIAYSIGVSPSLKLTLQALQAALATLPAGATPVVHSDQGTQYQSSIWHRHLKLAGAIPSMSRAGNCYDNAVIESFFSQLKVECFHHRDFPDAASLIAELHSYIQWYNNERISTRQNGLSPVKHRAQVLAA